MPSRETATRMARFYAELGAGKNNSEALQAAKLAARRAGGDARAWAGFVLAGADK